MGVGHREMSPLEAAILGLYFLTLVILAVFGLHRYIMVYLYFRHRDRRAQACRCPNGCRASPCSFRCSTRCTSWNACSTPSAASTIRRSCSRSRCSTTPPTRRRRSRAGRGRRIPRAGFDIHYLHRADRTGFKAGALDAGLDNGHGRVRPDLRRRLRGPGRHPGEDARPLPATRRSAWCRRAGATSTATTRCSRRCSRCCSTATSSSSTAGATAPAASSTSTARRACGGAR